MTDNPLVFVIVVNYNGIKYLKPCLSSLEQQTYPNYKIIVFDNASTDNSAEFIRQNFPKIKLIQAKRNLGFAEGNNLAIKFALDQEAEYVFLVNNDTDAEKDLIEKLISTGESDDSIGIVGPVVFDLKNKRSIQEMGMAVDRFGYPLAIKNPLDKDSCLFFVSGCAMMIKSELIRRIGFFDEKYFMFAEDLDLCWRAQLSGYKIAVNDNARIYHASGGSISGGVIKASSYKTTAKRVFLREKNTLTTLIKNYGTINVLKVLPFYVSLLLLESFFWLLIKPEISKNISEAIFWNIKNIPDTLQKRALVQTVRKISDHEIAIKMMGGYIKLRIFITIGVPNIMDSKSKTFH